MATLDTAAEDTLPLEGSRLDWKAVGAVALGNMLEFYDFITFSFFAVDIGRAFFPSKDPTTSLLSSLAVFWSNGLVGTIMTIGVLLLLWPLLAAGISRASGGFGRTPSIRLN